MSCPICNSPDYIQCGCDLEPYCLPCSSDSNCVQKIDAECVIYHRDDNKPSKLTCMGIPNKTPIETILETIDGFICQLNTVQTPLTAIDSPTIDLTAWGVLKHTLQADVKISSASGNTLVALGDGLYISQAGSQVPITPIDSNSVNLTAFGTLDHTLQADVIISPDAGNALEIRSNGLFAVDASGNTVATTADNGLTKTLNNIQLGGVLLHDTSIATTNHSFNILTDGGHFNFDPSDYIAGIQDGIDPTSNQCLQVHNAGTFAVQCATLADLALLSFYSSGFSSTGIGEVIMAVHYPQSNDLSIPLPLIDASLTAYAKVSKNVLGGTGLIELYAKDVLITQVTNAVDDTATYAQSNVLYTNTVGKVCSAPLLTASAVLDFLSTPSNASSDLTISVPGAADGDVVAIGVPAASAAIGTFWGFVSADNTVTIRFHNTAGGATDPASGTFKVKVFKG